jgi:hypothetical protein
MSIVEITSSVNTRLLPSCFSSFPPAVAFDFRSKTLSSLRSVSSNLFTTDPSDRSRSLTFSAQFSFLPSAEISASFMHMMSTLFHAHILSFYQHKLINNVCMNETWLCAAVVAPRGADEAEEKIGSDLGRFKSVQPSVRILDCKVTCFLAPNVLVL